MYWFEGMLRGLVVRLWAAEPMDVGFGMPEWTPEVKALGRL